MVTETEKEADLNAVKMEKNDGENKFDSTNNEHEHLDRIREEDESGDENKTDEINEIENPVETIMDDKEQMTKSYVHGRTDNDDVIHSDEKVDENSSDKDDKDETKVDDTPLINKSDKIVINISSSNPLIAEPLTKDIEKRRSCTVDMSNEKSTRIERDELFHTPKQLAKSEPNVECVESNEENVIELPIPEIEDEPLDEVNNAEKLAKDKLKIELNGNHGGNHEGNNIQETNKQTKKSSIWSKFRRSSEKSKDSNMAVPQETFKSTETSIEIIKSPAASENSEKINGSVETAETMEIAMINTKIPEAKKPDEKDKDNMISTHLMFRVQSPYLKYIFSCTILVVILLICALLVIIFPATFNIEYLKQHLANLYNNGNQIQSNIIPTVDSNCGQYRGVLGKDNMAIFRGIRYAKAPLNERRWLPADAIECNKSQVIEAYDFRDFCYQRRLEKLNMSFSEDCLYLNIWVPSWGRQSNVKKAVNKLPVFIYLAGDMITGYNSMDIEWLPNGADMAKEYNAIFVTLNYRFGVFGFLSSEILHRRSRQTLNYGLSDIMAAIKWINENIESFGGDTEAISILAHGSSASLALAAATNDETSKYINRLWLSSPAPSFTNTTKEKAFEMSFQFINAIGCQPNISQAITQKAMENQIIDCLLKISPEELTKAMPADWYETFNQLPSSVEGEFERVPVLIIDDVLIKGNPYDLIDYTDVEIVIGMNIEDSGAFSSKPSELKDWNDSNFTNIIRSQLAAISPLITDEVINQYIDSSEFISNEQIYHRLVTEIRYICPLFMSIENLTNKENVYLYLNKYKPSHPIRYTSDHSESKMTVHGIDVIAMLNLMTNWFVVNPVQSDLNFIALMKSELKGLVHTSDTFRFKNLTNNEINLITQDGQLSAAQLPVHNCHRFWSAFNRFAKVN